ncbi:DUF2332 domain-containing protein [Halobacillus litoralis]|uniref:DUF2332 domain-containing protein n=1 Tax=Halobacillus litoralis TaxID=45668 RepID=UPI00248FA43A|nr:DUF2332 domain-containing protein [Halobacillus litoralis]
MIGGKVLDTNQLKKIFEDFAEIECEGSSLLYKTLALKIAEDEELLNLCSHAQEGQPIPNLLFGSVHYLLLQGKQHHLQAFYPSIVAETVQEGDPYPFFQDFCEVYREEIIALLRTKLVQTNEVGRCAYLYPAFCHIHQKTEKPLSLIEIGSSAGLQLLWDQYSYSYGTGKNYGNENSVVHLTSKVREGSMPDFLAAPPLVKDRVGVDLQISDLTDEEEYLWLKALIWPEHKERLHTFDKAVEQLRIAPPKLIEGDGVAMLSDLAGNSSEDEVLCIFHTHVANQMPETVKTELLQKVNRIGSKRDVFHIYNNISDRKLHMDSFFNGIKEERTIGDTEGHGKWFDWKLPSFQ